MAGVAVRPPDSDDHEDDDDDDGHADHGAVGRLTGLRGARPGSALSSRLGAGGSAAKTFWFIFVTTDFGRLHRLTP